MSLPAAFWVFIAIGAITPGPNNVLALSSTSTYGFRRTLPLLLGFCAGMVAISIICGLFASRLALLPPAYLRGIGILGVIYIVWLAWKVARSTPAQADARAKPLGFIPGFMLQAVNVKVVVIALTALATFVIPFTNNLAVILGVSVIRALMGSMGNFIWASAGKILQRYFLRYGRIINIVLGILLLFCAFEIYRTLP